MKKLFTLLTAGIVMASIWAQSPQKMTYQAVIRNSSNQLVTSQAVGMKISILQGSNMGTIVYTETQTPTTNANGLITIEIGVGTGFDAIDWANGPYFIKTETDPTGGTNYTITGTSQILSVPYALHAKTAETLSGGITETDPVFVASPANGIYSTDISNWNTAYSWGNHADAGYLKSFSEIDPVFGTSPAKGITITNITNWTSAYSWGNHATAGYLKSYTETDPVFVASPANGISLNSITNWNNAYNWGNHANAGYLKSYSETDPLFGKWNKSTGINITASQVSDFQASVTNNTAVLLNSAKNSYPTTDQLKLAAITGTNTGDETTATIKTKLGITTLSGSNTGDQTLAGLGGVASNTAITGATKTKITYDTKGLVTAGTNATTADIAASIDKNYVTDTQLTVIKNTSGTNTGDQNLAGVLTQGTDAGNKKIINVNQQGIGTATPNACSALEISSTTQGFLPPRMTQAQRDAITAVEGLIVYNITTKKPCYYTGFEWMNFDGTSDATIAIGSHYLGGIIAYILQPGDPGYDANVPHGLIAAPSDQSNGIQWYNGTLIITGAYGTALGTGNANTNMIVSVQGTGSYAAKLCYDLVLNGFSDWYLPSKDELNKLYLNKVAIGNFTTSRYWSSTEGATDSKSAWIQNFNDGVQAPLIKNDMSKVRAIRTF